MEVEEENNSNHLQESTATVSNERLLVDNISNDKELRKETPESITQEEKEKEKESTNNEKEGDDGVVKDEIPTGDVAAVECGGSELTQSCKVDGGECAAAENGKDGGDGETETVKVAEDGGGVDVPMLSVAETDEQQEMKQSQKENVEIVQRDEEITEVIAADEEEALGVKEESKMADEEKAVGITENDDEEAMAADEEKSLDTELETDEEKTAIKTSKGKRKRGRKSSRCTPKPTPARSKSIEEEDVCFICFDGGDLVLCDQRTCPKAYHPFCVHRDAAFFQTKGRWNCGWHVCSICVKKAEYMCYTCTFSLCKRCFKKNNLLCFREKEKKGICEACMKTVMLIEKNLQDNEENMDLDLFKDYWIDIKSKLNLSYTELIEATNAQKGSEPSTKQEPPPVQSDGGSGSASENPNENQETKKKKRRKRKKQKSTENNEWATKELLEFVSHMENGDKSYKTQFDVQALLLEYIKTNNLRDPRRKTQIICDKMLEGLFGKSRVGHFEMLKLLEAHFLVKEDSEMDDVQGSVVDTEVDDDDDEVKSGRDRKRKIRKKNDREPQLNRESYAAINNHNINVIYLRRKLVEDLLSDNETFRDKVVGNFVRIRISGANQKNDIYRLVQVTGITKAEQYTVGKKTTDIMLEILNLDKTESVSIDTISNQDFTEDECKRLRQSIRCGLINSLTVGDILDKAMQLQAARVDDWLETEVLRLSHLRDRASDLGRKKELRVCVEKLQVLKTPEERTRRLQELPVIHSDPTMDPNYGSEDDSDEDDKKQDVYKSPDVSRYSKRQDYPSKSGTGNGTSRNNCGKNYERNRSFSSNSFSNKVEDNENLRDQEKDIVVQQPIVLKKPSSGTADVALTKDNSEADLKLDEKEKMWHYKDPTGKIQGPFSMTQLRKWNNNKFFPVDLRIWKKSETEENGVVLTDALEGRFTQNSCFNRVSIAKVETPRASSVIDEKQGFATNLPSPTPNRDATGSNQVGPSSQTVQSVAGQSLPVEPYGLTCGPPQLPPLPPPQTVQSVAGQSLPVEPNGLTCGPPQLPPLPPPPPPPPAPPRPSVSWRPVAGHQNMIWGSHELGWIPAPPAQGGGSAEVASSGWGPREYNNNRSGGYSGQKMNRGYSGYHGGNNHRRQWENRGR